MEVIIILLVLIMFVSIVNRMLMPKARKNIVQYVEESSIDRVAYLDAASALQPSLDESLSVCHLTRNDLLSEPSEKAAWNCWPEKARTIHYETFFSDRIIYERVFFGKEKLFVHHQILNCNTSKRKDQVRSAAYGSLNLSGARVVTHQYRARRSNLLPNNKLWRRYNRRYVISFPWFVIPLTKGDISTALRILSFGPDQNKAWLEKIRSIQNYNTGVAKTLS